MDFHWSVLRKWENINGVCVWHNIENRQSAFHTFSSAVVYVIPTWRLQVTSFDQVGESKDDVGT